MRAALLTRGVTWERHRRTGGVAAGAGAGAGAAKRGWLGTEGNIYVAPCIPDEGAGVRWRRPSLGTAREPPGSGSLLAFYSQDRRRISAYSILIFAFSV